MSTRLKQYPIIALLCCLPLVLCWSRPSGGTSSAFALSVGGGWSDIAYRPLAAGVSNGGSWGMTAHAGYTFFFTPKFGLSVGADVSRYGATVCLPDEYTWQDVTDTDGEPYEHHLVLADWRERHNALYVEIPVALHFSFPLDGGIRLWTDIGVKYGIALAGGTRAKGTLTHMGWYGKWNLMLYDLPPYGFYTTDDFCPRTAVRYPDRWTAFLKFGVSVPLTAHLDFTCGMYFSAGLTDMMPSGRLSEEIGFRNDRPGMEDIHAFMPDYTNLLNTNLLGTHANAFAAGLEIGVSYHIPHRKHYHCRCIFD